VLADLGIVVALAGPSRRDWVGALLAEPEGIDLIVTGARDYPLYARLGRGRSKARAVSSHDRPPDTGNVRRKRGHGHGGWAMQLCCIPMIAA
jgi:hypothetical protein